MDELNPILPPNLDTALNEFYAAPRPDPAFATRLEARLRQRQSELSLPRPKRRFSFSDTRRTFMRTLRAHPILALLTALLALLALTGIAYALGRMTGFIPGFGFTAESGPVTVLAEPVDAAAGEISLHVEQAVNDAEHFWVELTAAGLAEPELDPNGLPEPVQFPQGFVLLADGEKVSPQSGGSTGPDGGKLTLSFLFPPLAGQPTELTLLIENLAGQDFTLPLSLRPVEADELVALPPQGNAPLQSEDQAGLSLVLDRVAVDSRKTVLQVSLHYDQPDTWPGGQWNVTLSDEDGALYPLSDITPDTVDSGSSRVYQTLPFHGDEQLLLSLTTFPPADGMPLFLDLAADSPGFTLDLGADPQVGQHWDLDQPLSAGRFSLRVVGATLTNQPGLTFEVEPGPDVTGVMFNSSSPLVKGATSGEPVHSGNLTPGITFSEVPAEPFEVKLMRVSYQAKGTWQIHWQPPAAPTPRPDAPTPSPLPTLVTLPSATPAEANSLLREVQELTQKFDAPFQQGPAWIHTIRESAGNPSAGQDYPPPYLKSELWYEVDEEGYVTRYVWSDYNQAGQLIQQAATVGDYSVNFTYGTAGFNRGVRYRFSTDTLTQSLGRLSEESGAQVTREESTCSDGRPCLRITLVETFTEPVQNPGQPQAFSGAGNRVWIDPESGQQVTTQSFWRLADGGELVTSTQTTTLIEKLAAAPQAILDILSRVVVP